MRDPKRIEEVLQQVRTYWYQNPDLRLGQILTILSRNTDVFYLEDAELIKRLKEANNEKAN